MSDQQLDDALAEARRRFLGDKPVKKSCRIEQEPAAAEPWWESRGYASLQEALSTMLPKIRIR